ncbi:hypothetical protein EDEG_00277 [Edhazardia aedis USNM 41457]|uniref:Major facilitator superfamily associated domain-containing protein n=1 Tax=Edhazardia aedis (strain USNM 41457) TaxID=1003232 RepID=J9D4J2_EDHAE|nr:hypothetical protein EDEG_00277 [Edhazardia aedis USNM 41457]|eukprot:EJW02474.1 hypothetical protein EDEG_00277 [Edhazardia aedis USNM 41457]
MTNFFQKINRRYLLSPKILFFAISIQFYTLYNFKSNFLTEKFNIKKSEIGIQGGRVQLITFFVNALMASFFDKFRKPRLFIITLMILSCTVFQIFFLEQFEDVGQLCFWAVFLLYSCLSTCILPMCDKTVIEYLEEHQINPKYFGRQVAFGTLGYIVVNYIVEKLITNKNDNISVPSSNKYDFNLLRFYYIGSTIVAVFFAFLLIRMPKKQKQAVEKSKKGWLEILKNTKFMCFLLIILFNGITRTAASMYLTIYWKDVLKLEPYHIDNIKSPFLKIPLEKINSTPISTAIFCGVFCELLIFLNGSFITKLLGIYWPILFAQLFQLMRFSAYLFLKPENKNNFFFVCLIELLKGFNFGLTHISAAQLATNLCPKHLKTTAQILYSGTFVGLGSFFGGLIFGYLFKIFEDKKSTITSQPITNDTSKGMESYRAFFITCCCITLTTIIFFILRYGLIERKLGKEKKDKNNQKENEDNKDKEESFNDKKDIVNLNEIVVDDQLNDKINNIEIKGKIDGIDKESVAKSVDDMDDDELII